MSEGVAFGDPNCQDFISPDRRGEWQTRHSKGSRNSTQNYIRRNQDTKQTGSMMAGCKDDKGGQDSSQKEIDLEKGKVLDADAELRRTDSGMPLGSRGGSGKGKEERHGDYDAD
jgi:hypothetical protein